LLSLDSDNALRIGGVRGVEKSWRARATSGILCTQAKMADKGARMAENPETAVPESQNPEDRRRATWLPWVVLAIVLLLVFWLLRGYSSEADNEPRAVVVKTVTIKPAPIKTPDGVDGQPVGAENTRESVVPNVVGLFESEAADALEDDGFRISVTRLTSTSEPIGVVFEQTPAAYEPAEPGDAVAVLVSLGPETTEMTTAPDMVGLSTEAAKQEATSRGLLPRVMMQPKPESKGRVYEQQPAPGTQIKVGEKVFILVGYTSGD